MAIRELAGVRLFNAADVNMLSGLQGFQVKGPITAHAGGARPLAVPLIYGLNSVNTVGTAADSVVMPAAKPGCLVLLANVDAADATQVFGQGTDTINGTAGATGVSVAATKNALFFCVIAGAWRMILTA